MKLSILAATVLHRLADFLFQPVLKMELDVPVSIGRPQKSSIFSAVYTKAMWQQLNLQQKLSCLLRRKWYPDAVVLQAAGRTIALYEIFGNEEDFGSHLLAIECIRGKYLWSFDELTEHDENRATALEGHAVVTRQRLRDVKTFPPLNLQMGTHYWNLCLLMYPMAVKIPVRSIQHFLSLHTHYAFNQIRKSGHFHCEELIAYLYDLLFLQQKTAIALLELFRSAAYVHEHKKDAMLINAETNAIMEVDLIFSYLKASIEKTVAIVGLTYGINLTGTKEHNKRLNALRQKLLPVVKATPYCQLLMDSIKSENLEGLNKYRSGILHKKGIAELQPHQYSSIAAQDLPLLKLFETVHEQHVKNTATLLAALAMLADELVRLSPPGEVALVDGLFQQGICAVEAKQSKETSNRDAHLWE